MTRGDPWSGGLPRRAPAGLGSLTFVGLIAAVAGIVAQTVPAKAATSAATIAVSATIVPTCSLTVPVLAFGIYTGVQNDTTTTITTTCTNTTPYSIGVNAGTNPGGSYYQWNLAGPGASLLAYRLYRDAGRTALWGGSVGNDTVGGTGNGASQAITMYGRELSGQFVRPGAYSDTVTLTLYY